MLKVSFSNAPVIWLHAVGSRNIIDRKFNFYVVKLNPFWVSEGRTKFGLGV